MIKIFNINFSNKTIENVEVMGDNIKGVDLQLTKNKFNISIIKDDKIITKEISKNDIIDNEVIEIITEEPKEITIEEPQEIIIEKEVIIDEPIEEVIEECIKEFIEEPIKCIEEPIECIEEPIECIKEVIEEPIECIKEGIEEPIECIEEQKEVIEEAKITLQQMKELLMEKLIKKNTIDTYYRTIKTIYQKFKILDVRELLKTKEKEIVEYLENEYKVNGTLKNKFCCIYKAYKLLNIESLLLKGKIELYKYKDTIQLDKDKDANKKSIDEADIIIKKFNNEMEALGKNIQEDLSILNEWKQDAQLYCILKIYLTYGVLRPSELIDCLITETDDDNDNINYINIKTKKIVIHKHKNDVSKKTKIIDIDDKNLLSILRKGLGKHLILNNEKELYKSSSSLTKLFKRKFDYNPYDLRKAISSKFIFEGDIEKIKKLEMVQGHSLDIILKNYNIYNKCVIE